MRNPPDRDRGSPGSDREPLNESADKAEAEKVSWRVQAPVYAAGLFSNSMTHMISVVLPLWVLSFEDSALVIGVVIGARQVLPVLFAIHGGALMDRLGIRKVMIAFAVIGAIVPFGFPLFPFIPAVIALQMLSGISAAMGWIGTQAHIGAAMKGSATYAGRMTVCNRFGALAGPPLIGAAWDGFGVWGGFGTLGLWALGLLAASILLPPPKAASVAAGHGKVTPRDLLPKPSDYAAAFKLLSIPAIALVIMLTLLRHSGNGIQGSFYIVYLESIGISATAIGLLISAASVLGIAGSLLAAPLARIFKSHWLLLLAAAASVLFIAITPALGTYFLLVVAAALRGGAMGLAQPLMISVMAGAAGDAQGKAVGLRTTANRVIVMVVPVIMGGAIEFVGLANSFYLVGGALLATLIPITLHIRRSPAFR